MVGLKKSTFVNFPNWLTGEIDYRLELFDPEHTGTIRTNVED
jgi:hypothetical protein